MSGAYLIIETSGARCAAAVAVDGALSVASRALQRGHDAAIAGLVGEALSRAGVGPGDIARVGVCVGPGGFTGVRVGAAFARAFGAARTIPVIGLNALDVWATQADAGAHALVVATHDARRGEVYWRAYRGGVGLGSPARQSASEAAAAIDTLRGASDALIIGAGAAGLAGPGRRHAPDAALDLAVMARMTAQADPADHHAHVVYARPPDADPPKRRPPVGAAR